jgi:anti-sigma factor ChrR (cupin superfamily)
MDTPTPPGPDRPLDADIEALLDQAIEPAPLDAATQARIKSKLLRRIAQHTTDSHLTLKLAQGQWQPFGRGLQIKVLNAAEGGVLSYLVRMAAGSRLPAHRHPVDEECVVLEGEVRIGTLRIAAGGFHLGRKDVLHDDLHSVEGALIFLRGAAPELAQVV